MNTSVVSIESLVKGRLGELSEALNERLGFTLNEPRNVTVFMDKGYRKRPLIGGEQFKGVGANQGKRDIIIMMEPIGDDPELKDVRRVEFTLAEAMQYLDGFPAVVDEIMDGTVEEALLEARAKAQEEEMKLRLETAESYGPSFGSW